MEAVENFVEAVVYQAQDVAGNLEF